MCSDLGAGGSSTFIFAFVFSDWEREIENDGS
jgi:hypothetical protein